jgi:colicin import membrane protein
MINQRGDRMAMFSLLPAKPKNAFYFSLALHLIVLTILVVSFDFSAPMPVVENSANKEVINAVVMDAPHNLSKIIQKPVLPKPMMPPPPKLAEAKPIPPSVKPLAEPKIVKPVNKPQVVPIAKPTIAISDKKQKKTKEDFIQKQLLADLKKQTQHQKKIKQTAIQSEFEKEMNDIKAKSLQQQMLQEQKRLASVMTQQTRGVVDKYKALILQTISQHWIIPSNIDKHLTAELLIRLAPGGLVLDVELIKSSGDEALDRSARAAVFKSSPLPVPTDIDAFESFKQFVLKVKPENVLLTDNIV